MSLYFHHLDPRTRTLMHDEVNVDFIGGRMYLSPRLSDAGRVGYVPVLLTAIAQGDPTSFANELAQRRMLNATEISHSRTGMPYVKAVPHDAHATLAEGEFNRYYIRALCVRAAEDGLEHLEIYRAKVVHYPRGSSEARIGRLIRASALLTDLRNNVGVDTAFGLPNGPNSGLSARLPANSNKVDD